MARDPHQVMLRFRSSVHADWLTNPALRRRLVEEAETRGSNVTDVIVQALSEHYGVEYDLTGRRSTADPDAAEMTVRLPPALHQTVKQAVGNSSESTTVPREVLRVLCVRFSLDPEPAAVPA